MKIITIVERECGGIFGGISFFYQIIWDIGSIEGERDVFAQPFIFLPPIRKPLIVARMSKLFKYFQQGADIHKCAFCPGAACFIPRNGVVPSFLPPPHKTILLETADLFFKSYKRKCYLHCTLYTHTQECD